MAVPTIASKPSFWLYRMTTILKSFKALYTLPPEKVDAFLQSYENFDHDWVNEEALVKAMGADYYNEVKKKIIDYYSVLNHLCSLGQVEKMYIPPAIDLNANIIMNQALFEQRMCRDMRIKKGDKVLDIGCGRGRIAAHVAQHTGAQVTGINIDPNQLETGRRYAESQGLPCQFVQADLNLLPLPFKDKTFDAVYHVQVFSYSKDLGKLFKDIYRILKPGGRVSCLDWLRLDAYDAKNPHHVDLMRRIKPLIGAIGTPSIQEYVTAMKQAGFKVLINENASIDGLQAPLIENADKFFTRVTKTINFLVKVKLLPAHFKALFDRLVQDGQAFVEADRMRLVTTSHYFIGEK